MLKLAAGTTGALGVAFFALPRFRLRFDNHILRPIRDYRAFLSDYNRIQTQVNMNNVGRVL